MDIRDRGGPRRAPYETAGTVDHPFDEDRPASHQLIQSDAACSITWLVEDFEAVQVFVDPALRERAQEICQSLAALCGRETSIDDLNESVQRYASSNGLSASLYEQPRDALTNGVLAIAFTYG